MVYTYKLQTNPHNSANALSAFGGVLSPSGVTKFDDHTVVFHLEAPNGNFPYLTSSENYNMIILPDGYDPAEWQRSFVGTGPFVLTSYVPGASASFTRNSQYWGPKALPAATEFTFYDTQAPQILALSSGNSRRHRPVRGIRRRATASPRRPVQHHQAALQRASRTVDAL